MADLDLRDNLTAGTPIPRKTGSTISAGSHTILQNIGTMKTYLLTQGYTAAQLNAMTRNDIVYATNQKLGI